MARQRNIQTQTETQQLLPAYQLGLVKLIELSETDLEERVRNEMLENAALEERDAADATEATERNDYEEENLGAGEETPMETALADYRSDDDVPDYLLAHAYDAEQGGSMQVSDGQTFYEHLQQQIGEYELSPTERQLMDYLIGSLDDDGFLRKDLLTLADELAVFHYVDTSAEELERLLGILQRFEPRGIGARSLQECLHLQLTDPDYHSPWREHALKVVDRYFKDFVSKRWDHLKQRLKLDDEAFGHVLHELTHLNPTPGRTLGEEQQETAPTIVPDFSVTITPDGEAIVRLNNSNLPALHVSQTFRHSLDELDGDPENLSREQLEAHTYAKKKVEDAQAFIYMLEQRNKVLLDVMQTIVRLQRPFFDDDDELLLQPMVLKDIAQRLGISISTVSRVTGTKYVQTAYGVYPLKFFFSTQFVSDDGSDLSSRQIKCALLDIIGSEDKKNPLTDEAIAAALKEKGQAVARRTVTKYREQLEIPTARLRRE